MQLEQVEVRLDMEGKAHFEVVHNRYFAGAAADMEGMARDTCFQEEVRLLKPLEVSQSCKVELFRHRTMGRDPLFREGGLSTSQDFYHQ